MPIEKYEVSQSNKNGFWGIDGRTAEKQKKKKKESERLRGTGNKKRRGVPVPWAEMCIILSFP